MLRRVSILTGALIMSLTFMYAVPADATTTPVTGQFDQENKSYNLSIPTSTVPISEVDPISNDVMDLLILNYMDPYFKVIEAVAEKTGIRHLGYDKNIDVLFFHIRDKKLDVKGFEEALLKEFDAYKVSGFSKDFKDKLFYKFIILNPDDVMNSSNTSIPSTSVPSSN